MFTFKNFFSISSIAFKFIGEQNKAEEWPAGHKGESANLIKVDLD